MSVSGDLGYNASTGVFSFTERTDAEVNSLADTRIALNVGTNLDLSNQDTGDLAEGTNLYYTNARADARIALQVGANLDLSSKDTGDLAEGSNLYYTQARADARVDAGFTAKSTSDLSEGTNLYYTDARADARVAAAASNYATAAQGTLADSATQPGDLATVATSGSYNDLSNLPTLFSGAYADLTGKPTLFSGAYADLTGKPTLGSAAATDSTAYATAAQGTQADTNNTDIDDLYTALNAIGNDNSITTVAQLKAALVALTR